MSTRRAKVYHLTRNRNFLMKASGIIMAIAILLSLGIQFFREGTGTNRGASTLGTEDVGNFQVKDAYNRLRHTEKSDQEALIDWLRHASSFANDAGFLSGVLTREPLSVAECEIAPLVQQHTHSEAEKQMFMDYAVCRLLTPSPEAAEARQRLVLASTQQDPLRYAGELMGDLFLLEENHTAALQKYLLEIGYPDAARARASALTLALATKDSAALRTLVDNEQLKSEASPQELREAAMELEDRDLLLKSQWRGFLLQWTMPIPVGTALLAAGIWTVVVMASAGLQRRAAVLPMIAALLCGILSVELIGWFQDTLKYNVDEDSLPTAAQQIFHWIMYVGIPEEAVKLLFCLPLIPWLLKSERATGAAMLGGGVGLGFALAENLGYFAHYGESVAIGRLLTANFLHASLTGLLGWQLYDLFRSRFHRATEFLVVFLIISVVHGLYDFCAGQTASEMGLEILAIIILALCARQFLHRLVPEYSTGRGAAISRTAVFVFGAVFLAGVVMIVMTLQIQSSDPRVVTAVLKAVLSLIPVAMIYIHEFREMES